MNKHLIDIGGAHVQWLVRLMIPLVISLSLVGCGGDRPKSPDSVVTNSRPAGVTQAPKSPSATSSPASVPSSTSTTPSTPAKTASSPASAGDSELPCYVLEDGRRVFAQRGTVSSLGLSRGSSAGVGGDRLLKFLAGKSLEPFIGKDWGPVTDRRILFKTQHGQIAHGYEATILADIGEVVLAAHDAGNPHS